MFPVMLREKFTIVVILILLGGLLFSCNNSSDRKLNSEEFTETSPYSPQIAKGFRISQKQDIRLLEIFNPWDTAFPAQKFYLVPEVGSDSLFSDGQAIKIPIKSMVCLSASHLSFLDALGEIDKLTGVSSADFVVSEEFQDLVKSGEIREIGIGDHFRLEELINLSPDMVMVSPQKGQSFDPLVNAGLTVIPIGDYLEPHPLGRAEWIKLIGVLTGREQKALEIFDSVSAAYDELKKLTAEIDKRPTVITGKQYGGFWNLAGGKSYVATFLHDAGADYLWAGDQGTGGIMLDFETVYNKGINADYWRFLVYSGSDFTYEMLKTEDKRYADFSAFKNKQVIYCNTLKKPLFQKGLLEPQVILADYIRIFHPGLLPDHENVYYELLK